METEWGFTKSLGTRGKWRCLAKVNEQVKCYISK